MSEKDGVESPSYGNDNYEILYNKKSEDILQYVNRLHHMTLILTGSRCAYQFYSDFTQFNIQHSLIEGSVLCYIDLKQYM